ncbi:MAG: hypothetical protein QG646_377 [Euryarchaeota archaeon]|nr:hypothetical protein [Euryarchaeota archaeon]
MRKTIIGKVHKGYASVIALGIIIVALLMLVITAVAAAATGVSPFAYITNSASNNVSVIDTASNNVTATVNVGSLPFGVAANTNGKKVYVANYLSNNVSVIDTATNTVTATIDVGNLPFGIAVNPQGTRVYVANYLNNTVSIICTSAESVLASVDVQRGPCEVAVSPDGKKVYVTSLNSNNISIINTATNTVTAAVNVGSPTFGVAVTPDGKKVYVTNANSTNVSVIDAASNTVTATVPVGTMPWGVAVNPQGTKVYVANSDSNTVSVINTTTNIVVATVSVGSLPCGISVNPQGTKVYVANSDSNNVSVIDAATNTVTATVNVGSLPVAFGQFIVPLSPVLPVANFSSNVTHGYAPLAVKFTDLSKNATGWNWNFGDGANSTVQNTTHKYSTAGNYTVTLTVSNANGTDAKSSYIVVSNGVTNPVAAFSASPSSGSAPLNVSFTDESAGLPTARRWYFSDGTNSTDKNPVHTFSKPGIYYVTLTVSNAVGSSWVAKYNYITVSNSVDLLAAFSASPTSGSAPLNVSFTDKSTGSPTAWRWSFSDGTNSTDQNPVHTFSKPGIYFVTLTVSNAGGNSWVTKYNYIIVPNDVAVPVAAFSASPTSGSAPLNVIFTDESTGSPTSWKWYFGDGTGSTDKNPVHTFSKSGAYNVGLTVTNSGGSGNITISRYITVA